MFRISKGSCMKQLGWVYLSFRGLNGKKGQEKHIPLDNDVLASVLMYEPHKFIMLLGFVWFVYFVFTCLVVGFLVFFPKQEIIFFFCLLKLLKVKTWRVSKNSLITVHKFILIKNQINKWKFKVGRDL